ncbi:DegT/DnrJ/EryC1/StrS family aminotransferase [Ornithinibacillus xuwenensis]|uniref:DegT/DnrJ/EryC1/StrS family aminotransferase n=1 Tax=Ornithinibacillus xuwenensis TaxID=3144668 RepID=A0ABU9XMI9_9BACI
MIPLIDLKKQYESIQNEIVQATLEVLQSGQYILGQNVKELESQIAERLGVKHAIAVANGTDALVLTLDAYGIGRGDEVITTPFTFFATAEAITRVGATPVFVDIDSETFQLDASKITEKISSRTKAILPVHLFGQSANMDEILTIGKKHHLLIIEDACQAFGATYKGKRVGSIGDAACFSFFPTKNLGTIGDGGMITTSDDKLADSLRKLRVHGSSEKYYHHAIGYNSRLDELHAAILLICLEEIDKWNTKRHEVAQRYLTELKSINHIIQLPVLLPDRSHVFHLFCIQSSKRQEIISSLHEASIQTGIYYPQCLHLQKVYENLGYAYGDFPIAETVSNRLFAIPLHPFLPKEDQDVVISTLKKVCENL